MKTTSTTSSLTPVFGWMFLGLVVSGIAAFWTANSVIMATLVTNIWTFLCLAIVEIALVIFLSATLSKMSKGIAIFVFLLYSLVNGLTLSVVFMEYTIGSIFGTFFIAAGMFGVMALYGLITKKDLSGLGAILFMGLIGLLIAMLVNLFWQNDIFGFVVSIVGVIIFTALTAYDVQKIKNRISIRGSTDEATKLAIYGALELYLDFVNLFLQLLRIFGKKK